MDGGQGFDDRYVGRREYSETLRETDAALSAIREKSAGMEARMIHEIAGVKQGIDGLTNEFRAFAMRHQQPPQPHADQATLVLQRAMDLMQRNGASNNPAVWMLAVVIIGGACLVIGKFFL